VLRRRTWFGLGLALTLGACSRPESGARGADPRPAEAPASAAAAPTPAPDASAKDRALRAAGLPRGKVLRLALISSQPAESVARYGPLVDWLATQAGFEAGDLVVHDSADLVIGNLCDGSADLLLESVYPIVLSMLGCRSLPVALAAKGNSYRYSSAIVVHEHAPFESLADLGGHDVLFEDPRSTSAYLVPRSMLEQAGLTVESFEHAARSGAVRYRFGREEMNQVGWVVHGLAAAAAISDQDLAKFPDAELRVLAKSEPIPRQVVAVSPLLAASSRARVERALMAAASAGGKLALENANTAGFVALTSDDREFLAQMERIVQGEDAP
jgi:phosphonate transport system substrate-binding protein